MLLIVIVLFSFTLMFYILIKTIKENSISKRARKLFITSIILAMVMLITDGLSIMSKENVITLSIGLHYLVEIVYFISASVTCYFVFLLLDCLGDKPLVKKLKTRLFLTIPLYVYGLFVITSIWSGLIFSINDKSLYVRGPLNFFQFVFCYSYLFSAFALSLFKYIKGKADPNREMYFASILFCLMPTLGGVFQYMISILGNTEVPLISAGLALSTIIILVELIQNQVSIDSLTGLFSRKAFYNYLYTIKNSSLGYLYVYLIDIDKFKNINDTYGHLEGDRALELFAKALRLFTSKKKGVAARIGGDEFAIAVELVKTTPEEYLKLLIEDIDNINKNENLNYSIKASIGYALLEENDTIKDLIDKADKKMYLNKPNH